MNGTELAYREQGAGEPVVFVHGDLSDLRTWDRQVPGLAGSHRAIAYSRRYARPNEDLEPDQDNPMPGHVEDLLSLLASLEAQPAHLVGNSLGGFISLLAASRRPQAVRSLTLQEPPVLSLFVSNDPRPSEILSVLVKRPRTGLAILKFGGGTISPTEKAFRRGNDREAMETFVQGVLGKDDWEAMPEERKEQARVNVGSLRAGLLGEGFPPLSDHDVRAVEAPTLLMTGGHSRGIFKRLTDRLEELLPDTERVEIPGASHAMQEQEPDAVNAAILEFLARVDARPHA